MTGRNADRHDRGQAELDRRREDDADSRAFEQRRKRQPTPRGMLVSAPLVIGLATTLGGGWFATYTNSQREQADQAKQLAEVTAKGNIIPEFRTAQLEEIKASQRLMRDELQASQAATQASILRELDRLNDRLDRIEDRQN